VENMQTSSVLQQSLNQMQRSFYSDPQCKNLESNLQIFNFILHFLATSSMHNRSVIRKSLSDTNTYSHFPSPTHTTINISLQQPSASIAQNGASKADLPYRNSAPFGVLSKYKLY